MAIFDEEVFDDQTYKLVVAIVQRGYSDEAINAARSKGAKGAVVINGKGKGESKRSFFGFQVDPENETILILVKEEICVPVVKAIYAAVDFKSAARGMVFVLPVSYVSGMTHIKNITDEAMDMYEAEKEDAKPKDTQDAQDNK